MPGSQTSYPSLPARGPDHRGEPQTVPYRSTPPWGEVGYGLDERGVLPGTPAAQPQDRIIPSSSPEDLHARINLAYGHEALDLAWWMDDQYGYPPPGAPNDQSFQSGHTQITVHNPSSEQGWGQDPAFQWARYPHMENHAAAYGWGIARRNGEYLAPKNFTPLAERMQQQRDSRLVSALIHRLHGVVVKDVPSVSHTQNVEPVYPSTEPIMVGEAGVLP